MRMGRVWVGIVAVAFAITGLPGRGGEVRAQPGTELLRKHLPPTHFESGSFESVLVRAAEQYRLIVVYVRVEGDPTTKAMDERVWRNPTLAAHIRWHALAYRCEYGSSAARMFGISRQQCPAVVVARVNGKRLETLTKMCTLRNLPASSHRTSHRQTYGLEIDTGDIPDIYPGTLKVLQDTDTELEAVRARDPVWGAHHDRLNAEPAPPPDPDPVYETDDLEAPRVRDPEPLSGGPDVAGWIDVYARLEEARDAASAGDLYLATGLYTWLWEKGDKVDPSFRSAKRSVVAEEMRQLALDRPASRDRFRRLKTHYDERLLWATYERLGDWFLLNGVVNDEIETVAYLDLFVNDLDEGSMLPDCDKIAYRLLVGRDWNNAWDLGERPALPPTQFGSETRHKRVAVPVAMRAAQLVREDAGGRGIGLDASDRKKIDEFRAVYAVDECARLHAGCLRVGRDDDAWRVADILLGAHPDSAARLALVSAALAAGQVRDRHAELVAQAAAAGSPHPVLRQRVADALAAR